MDIAKNNYCYFVGIDIAKKKFDACIINHLGKKLGHKIFINSPDSFEDFLIWVKAQTNSTNVLFIMEYTGIYSRLLWFYLQDNSCDLVMESGFKINRAAGIKKGKNDKVDGYLIADYGFEKQHKLQLTPDYDEDLFVLHDLLSNRKRLIEQIKAIETPLNELKEYATKKTIELVQTINKAGIDGLKMSLNEIEQAIDSLIKENEAWEENIKYGSSVKGVSKIMVCWMIVYTRNFCSEFNARKFASMAGIAPFDFTSGSSVNRGSHVSHFSHKFLKGLLHMSAISALTHDPKIKAYYKRKKQTEGKKGFVAINNVKNKLVQIVFALIRTKSMYDDKFIHKLAS
jgi:transposase